LDPPRARSGAIGLIVVIEPAKITLLFPNLLLALTKYWNNSHVKRFAGWFAFVSNARLQGNSIILAFFKNLAPPLNT
jgi:hypothetical protein